MFTGIVEECGRIVAREDLVDACQFTIAGPLVTSDARPGDSIAVNGVCLTVVGDPVDEMFVVDVMGETLRRSSLSDAAAGTTVNLERAMPMSGRFGGHIVQGHVDGTGTVQAVTPGDNWTVIRVSTTPDMAKYTVEKGSITVDGVSLTVSAVSDRAETNPWLEVSLIPTTLAETTLGAVAVADSVNLEADVIAKYVQRLALPHNSDNTNEVAR